MLQDDMMADDVVSRPMYGFNSSYQFNDVVMPANNRTAFAWYLMYKTIDNCNTAISITATGDDNTADFRYSQGQAYALRAFCYLHLAQHYQFTYLKILPHRLFRFIQNLPLLRQSLKARPLWKIYIRRYSKI